MSEIDLHRRFGGIARLYGPTALAHFLQAHVAVIGVGGVGSWAVEALARSAIGELTLIDLDHVSESNINRQLPALEPTLGRAKVRVLAERVAAIHPGCRTHPIEAMLCADNLAQWITPQLDGVLDCIDGYRDKAALIAYCRRHKIPLITTGGAGGRSDPSQICSGDLSRTRHDPLLSKTRKLLRHDYGFSSNPKRRFGITAVWSEEQPRADASAAQSHGGLQCGGYGSSMAVTASFGLLAVAELLRRIAAPADGLPESSVTHC